MTLDHKTSPKCQFFKIEIYTVILEIYTVKIVMFISES